MMGDFEGVLTCEIARCGYTTASKYDMRKHLLFHSKTKNYVCPTCQKPFTTSSDLKRHERIHKSEVIFQCSFENCSFTTKRSDSLSLHERTHTSIETRLRHPCPGCGKLFSSHQIISRHLKKCGQLQEKDPDLRKCKVCSKTFSSVHKLNVHLRNHEGRLDFPCTNTKCDKKFATKYGLTKHLMTHDKRFECIHCRKMFSRKDVLETHMKSHQETVANLIVDYICSYCQLPFNSSEELLGHFEATEACSEGSQQPCVYQEVVHYQTDVETSEPSPSKEERVEPQNMIVVNNVINQQIIIIEEEQPVLLFKN